MLHPVTKVKNNVVTAVKNALDAFADADNPVVREKLQQAFPDQQQRQRARQMILDNLQEAYANASREVTDPKWFTPRNAMAGLAQSAMNARALQGAAQVAPEPAPGGAAAAPALAEAPLEQFGPLDPGWIECVVDGFKTLLEEKAPFKTHQSLNDFLQAIPDQITIAVVGDWGAHNDPAKRVAEQIRAAKPDIIVHLGDIYYAGQDDEAEDSLKLWPLADLATGAIPPGTSFGLNGNHEMFSGGHAYFEKVLPKFGHTASYFGLRNNFWQILAFDSAYAEHRLLPPEEATGDQSALASQWNWLVDKFKNSSLPTILLSHHEPISSFAQENSDGENLRKDFQKFVAAAGRQPFGWFFGHEHKCTIYDLTDAFPFRTRLIGHGCIPHSPPPPDQLPEPGCAPFFLMNTKANDNGDAVSGFALLKFNHELIDIQYINEDGSVFHQETWAAPQ